MNVGLQVAVPSGEISQRAMAAPTLAPSETIRILLLEDNPADADLCVQELRSAGLQVEVDVARVSQQIRERVGSRMYDVILSDYRLPEWNGLGALKWFRSSGYNRPLILVTRTLGDELAIEGIKVGVNDYVLNENPDHLPVAVRRALDDERVREERDRPEKALPLAGMLEIETGRYSSRPSRRCTSGVASRCW